jgi:hypothetical protein
VRQRGGHPEGPGALAHHRLDRQRLRQRAADDRSPERPRAGVARRRLGLRLHLHQQPVRRVQAGAERHRRPHGAGPRHPLS